MAHPHQLAWSLSSTRPSGHFLPRLSPGGASHMGPVSAELTSTRPVPAPEGSKEYCSPGRHRAGAPSPARPHPRPTADCHPQGSWRGCRGRHKHSGVGQGASQSSRAALKLGPNLLAEAGVSGPGEGRQTLRRPNLSPTQRSPNRLARFPSTGPLSPPDKTVNLPSP